MSFSSTKPRGEFLVWLTSAGLSIGLIMVVSILGLITAQGLRSFWPRPVSELTLPAGAVSPLTGGGPKILAEIHDTRANVVSGLGEYKLNAGNKDAFGQSFLYLPAAGVTLSEPLGVMRVERLEYGAALGYPVAFRPAGQAQVAADSPSFESQLASAVGQAGIRRERIRDLEQVRIGHINRDLKTLAEERRGKNASPASIETREKELQAAYEKLAAEARTLRAELAADTLVYRLVNGTEKTMPVGQIVGFEFPNRMGVAGRFGVFCHHLWTFLTDEPREANTEGGIAPAIFGTTVMTLLLSFAVTPFGVLAAIYLREYARQGFLVRCIRIAINNLAGVPSIVFGVFGLGFFVYTVGGTLDQLFFSASLPNPTFGTGGLIWCALTLALMTLPVVIVATEEAIAAVPRGAREASLALGASKWQTIQHIVLPASAPGILTGMILAMARGAGEVAPLMLVGVVKLAPSLPVDGEFPFVHLERKIMHLGFHIFDLGFQSPDSDAAIPMVFATTLFLIVLVVLLNLAAIVIRERLKRRFKTEAV